MKWFKLIMISLTLVAMLTLCKKDETTKDKLCGKYWISNAVTIDPPIIVGSTPITDFFSQMAQCWRDDLQKFDANGVYTFDEGASKCDVNDPQTVIGTWAFNQDESIATVTWGGASRSYTIISLSSTKLIAKYSEIANYGSGNLTYTYTITQAVQ